VQVVDRVLVQSGSQSWWGALIGRGKLQRGWNQHTTHSIVSVRGGGGQFTDVAVLGSGEGA